MLIQEKSLTHWINHFYGYGSWQAQTWFIAHEESGGDLPEDVADRLTYFSRTHPGSEPALCDIRNLYKHVGANISGPKAELFKTLYDYRFGNEAIVHNGWKNLVAFAQGYKSQKLPDPSAYQKKQFALPAAAQEALLNLYPLPAPHNHAWYYSWLDMPEFRFLKSRSGYEKHVYPDRINTILHKIRQHKPEVVLMYGMSNIQELKSAVQEFFSEAKFSLVKTVKQQIPQHHFTQAEKTIILITTQVPTLRHNRIDTGFDWYTFGKMVSQKFRS